MESTFTLGRVAGIRIGLNWSVLVIAWLVCWGLATEGFPTAFPDQSTGAYWAAGAVTAVLFFASLVGHELGHSLVARKRGVMVNEITLWMLGGMAKLEKESENARDELRIAVVGPLVSIALAFGFGLLAGFLELAGLPELVVAVPGWLASINLILAIFNLIPAFPMDGGRVLRAWLWKRHDDKLRATETAANAGRGFGWGLIILGLLVLTGGGGLGGLWFSLIGLFLVFASRAEAQQVVQNDLLRGVVVRDAMTPDPITAPAGVSVQDLLDHWVLRHHVSAYPLMDDTGAPVGLATLAHLRQVPPEQRATVLAGQVATPLADTLTTSPDTRLTDLLPELATSSEGRALVMSHGRLVGIVSLTDVTRAIEIRGLARSVGVRS